MKSTILHSGSFVYKKGNSVTSVQNFVYVLNHYCVYLKLIKNRIKKFKDKKDRKLKSKSHKGKFSTSKK
jgi:hypothetical protein